MYNIDFEKVKKGYKIYLYILVISILGIMIFYYKLSNEDRMLTLNGLNVYSNYIDVSSSPDEVGGTLYSVKYNFTANSNDYTCEVNVDYDEIALLNENTLIIYDPDNPLNCNVSSKIEMSESEFMILCGLYLLLLVGIINIWFLHRNIKKKEYLANYGTLIKGVEYEVIKGRTYINKSISPGTRNMKCLVINYQLPNGDILDGISYAFDKNIIFPDRCELLIDLNKPRNYYIDFNIDKENSKIEGGKNV